MTLRLQAGDKPACMSPCRKIRIYRRHHHPPRRPGPGFFVLERGSVEVYKDDIMLCVLMFPGTVFGELSDILDKPRTCTIKARTPTVVTKYQIEDMEAIIKAHPEIALKIFKTLASRLERTTQS